MIDYPNLEENQVKTIKSRLKLEQKEKINEGKRGNNNKTK